MDAERFDTWVRWLADGRGSRQAVLHVLAGGATAAVGNVYVADAGNHRIQKFDGSGNFLTKRGSYGPNPGQFSSPDGVAADGTGHLYATDPPSTLSNVRGRVQVFEAV